MQPGKMQDNTIKTKKLVVCIPAYNEERTIAKVVLLVKKYCDEVIVCDDGSTDMTSEIAEALGAIIIKHERNMGKGVTLRDLLKKAKQYDASAFVTIDADLQHNPDEIPNLVKPILDGDADIVVGTRIMKNAPKTRVIGNKVLDIATALKSGKMVNDTQSGFRAYSKKAVELLSFNAEGMEIESQTLIDAAKLGLRITSVPVTTTYQGIARKRNPASHFSSVIDYIVSRTVIESPLLYLGLPGMVLIISGIIAGIRVVNIFLETHLIAVGTGLISIGLIIIGTIMFASSLILKFLKAMSK